MRVHLSYNFKQFSYLFRDFQFAVKLAKIFKRKC